ncbi:hypothetical protein NPX13_g11314 [Xylaria arbuscula]|uniref:Uncharacterized protein n=1 Tax=Xylaria arbuscula TaxID=114810 RepID=A0A9W8TH24_9PEZI|nr:hypothetical protein NPX13_g11314 [Xylaria arbuscula]
MKHKVTLQSVTLVRVRTSGGIGDWKFLFALIRNHLPRLELSIQLCIAEGLILSYQVEDEDGEEEFEYDFDVGGNHENWTTAIQADIFIVLDGLDQVPAREGRARAWSKLLNLINNLTKARYPNLHILLISRDEQNIRSCLIELGDILVLENIEDGPNCDRLEALRDEEIQKANESLMQDEQGPLASPDDPPLSFASSQRTLMQFRLGSNTASSFGDSDTSANELALEVPSTKRTRRRGRQSANTDSEANEQGRLGNLISRGTRSILCIQLVGNTIQPNSDKLQLLVGMLVGQGIFDKATKRRLMVQYSREKTAKDNRRVVRLEHSKTTGHAAKVYGGMEFGNAVLVNHIYVAICDRNDVWMAMSSGA